MWIQKGQRNNGLDFHSKTVSQEMSRINVRRSSHNETKAFDIVSCGGLVENHSLVWLSTKIHSNGSIIYGMLARVKY